MTARRALPALLAAVVALLLTGCGVWPESQPRPLPAEAASVIAVPVPASPQNRAGLLTELWFIADDHLVPVNRTTDQPLSAQDRIQALEAGPTSAELSQGMRTAVTSVVPDRPLVATAESLGVPVSASSNQTAVVLSDDFGSLPSQEQLFILGQVVLTLASEPGSSVVFVNDQGGPVGVPLPNGRLSGGPVTSADYSPLIG